MLLELRAWIDDPRPYEKRHHKCVWSSLTKDAMRAFDAVGPGLLPTGSAKSLFSV